MLRGFSIFYKGSISLSNFCFCHLERVQVNDLLVDEFPKKPFYSSFIPGGIIFFVLYEEDTLNFHFARHDSKETEQFCENSLRRNSDNLILGRISFIH